MDCISVKDIVSIGKDIIVSIAAIATAIVAVYGINSWRREATGKARFESAKALLVAAYKVRDEIRASRSPLIVAGEFSPDFPDGAGGEERYRAYAHVYSNRWAPVKSALESFDAATIDAEAVIGADVRAAAANLRTCGGKLFAAVEGYLSNLRQGGGGAKDEVERSFRRVLHSVSEDDKFAKELDGAVSELERELLPHVQRAS